MGATTGRLCARSTYGYMPMAGESWIGHVEDADEERIALRPTGQATAERFPVSSRRSPEDPSRL